MTKKVARKHKRPVSLSEVVRRQLDALAKSRPTSTSVTLSRNAKGNTQIEVAVGAAEGETAEDAAARAREVYDALCERYPMKVEA